MIDWVNLGFNALWIFACALALAAFSYASWQASLLKTGIRKQLQQPVYQIIFNLAGLLFCLGLAGTASLIWERALWGVLALLFLVQTILTVRRKN